MEYETEFYKLLKLAVTDDVALIRVLDKIMKLINNNSFVLKRILGHECLDATEIYTHISDKKLKYIMENCTISSILERNGGQR